MHDIIGRTPTKKLLIIFLFVISIGIGVEAKEMSSVDRLEEDDICQIGLMVKSIQGALDNPVNNDSFETVIKYGHDSRYYNMISGWLKSELDGITNQHETTKEEALRQKHIIKIDFIKKSIRAIDLE